MTGVSLQPSEHGALLIGREAEQRALAQAIDSLDGRQPGAGRVVLLSVNRASDLPLWDMVFGTFRNPAGFQPRL